MIAKHLLTSAFVMLAFGCADSFGAASIRAGTVGASGTSGTSARAGSLRVGSGASVSTKAATVSSNTATTGTDSSRMPALPLGAPKVTTKPKLPSYSGGTVISGEVDLSDVYSRIDTVEDKADTAQSVAEAAGTTATAAKETAETAAAAVANKLEKPSGAGQKIVQIDSQGNVTWIAAPESNKVQLGYANQKLYYCKINDCGTANDYTNTSRWGSVAIDGLAGDDGKTTLLQLSGDKIQKCVSDNATSCTGSWSDLVNLNTYAKDADFQSLKNAVNDGTTGLAAAHSKINEKLNKPSGSGGAGKVLKWTDDGGVAWGDDNSANVQLNYANKKLYYCKVDNCGTFNTSEPNGDEWEAVSIDGLEGDDGKTAWLRKTETHIQACYKKTWAECTDTDYSNLIALSDLQGIQGDPGTPATIEVGTVEAVENYVAPTVTNSGTLTAAKFDFKIPKGANGREVKLQKGTNAIEYQYDGEDSWKTLVQLSDLKGEKGDSVCDSFSVEPDTSYTSSDGNKYIVYCITTDE